MLSVTESEHGAWRRCPAFISKLGSNDNKCHQSLGPRQEHQALKSYVVKKAYGNTRDSTFEPFIKYLLRLLSKY